MSIATVLHAGAFMLQAKSKSSFWREKASTQRATGQFAVV